MSKEGFFDQMERRKKGDREVEKCKGRTGMKERKKKSEISKCVLPNLCNRVEMERGKKHP